jgi:hypothetical protein
MHCHRSLPHLQIWALDLGYPEPSAKINLFSIKNPVCDFVLLATEKRVIYHPN